MTNYTILHEGFDGLDVAFKVHVPADAMARLAEAKTKAQENRAPEPVKIGPVHLLVLSKGGQGGYAYSCDTGDYGAIWNFKENLENGDEWGIRCSMKSLPLALHGIAGARAHMNAVLSALGLDPAYVEVSISRIDFCTDFLAPGFILDPGAFVLPARTKKKARHEAGSQSDFDVHSVAGRITYVRAGNVRRRQIVVYDKALDVTEKRKVAWWPIWNAALERAGRPPLDPAEHKKETVWRCEVRLGKDALVNRTRKVRSFEDLEQALGKLLGDTIKDMRLTLPCGDTNPSRWPLHPMWRGFQDCVRTHVPIIADDELVEEITVLILAQRREMIGKQIAGLGITYAALNNPLEEEISAIVAAVARDIEERFRSDPQGYHKKLRRALGRYAL